MSLFARTDEKDEFALPYRDAFTDFVINLFEKFNLENLDVENLIKTVERDIFLVDIKEEVINKFRVCLQSVLPALGTHSRDVLQAAHVDQPTTDRAMAADHRRREGQEADKRRGGGVADSAPQRRRTRGQDRHR